MENEYSSALSHSQDLMRQLEKTRAPFEARLFRGGIFCPILAQMGHCSLFHPYAGTLLFNSTIQSFRTLRS